MQEGELRGPAQKKQLSCQGLIPKSADGNDWLDREEALRSNDAKYRALSRKLYNGVKNKGRKLGISANGTDALWALENAGVDPPHSLQVQAMMLFSYAFGEPIHSTELNNL